MRYGTSYFVSKEAADKYYASYGYNSEDVQRKVDEGEIHIGKPQLREGQVLIFVDDGLRYGIIDPE